MAGQRIVVTLDGEIDRARNTVVVRRRPRGGRGDGVFETLLVRDGRACLVEPHLQRLTHSAKLMDLPEPDLPQWRHAIEWPRSGGRQAPETKLRCG